MRQFSLAGQSVLGRKGNGGGDGGGRTTGEEEHSVSYDECVLSFSFVFFFSFLFLKRQY